MEHASFGEVFNFGVLHMEWPTAVFIFAVFMATMFFLNILLFQPLLRTLDAREQMMTGSDDRMGEIEKELADLQAHYKATLQQSQAENEEAHLKALKEAQAEAGQITSKARQSAAEHLESTEKEVESQMRAALDEAKELAKGLADMIQNKVLAN